MWKKELTTLVTNNDRVYEKYKDVCNVILMENYEAVMIKVRDLIYARAWLVLPGRAEIPQKPAR